MITTDLNADILRNLGIITSDEGVLNRVAKELTDAHTEMTEEEFFARVDEAME